MPRLLSGSTLRRGGSGEFIDLAGAQPQLPPTPTTSTGYTLVTDEFLRTSYRSSLGNLEVFLGTIWSNLPDGMITLAGTGTGFVYVSSSTESTSIDSGALVVEGGIGIGGALWVDKDIHVNGLTIGQGHEGINNIVIQGVASPQANNFNNGQASIAIGYDTLTGISTAYKSIAIGRQALSSGTSLSNSLAIGDSALKELGSIITQPVGAITGATQTSPVVITVENHGLSTGTKVLITGVVGLTTGTTSLVNDRFFWVSKLSNDTLSLFSNNILSTPLNGTTYTPYISDGLLSRPLLRDSNIAFGTDAGRSLFDGEQNFFLGDRIAKNLTTGSYNVFIGHQVGNNIITGNANISIGGDNLVDGLNDQISISSVFYYNGGGYLQLNADTGLGIGTQSTGTQSGALVVLGGAGVGGDIWASGRLNAESIKISDSVFDSTLVEVSTTSTVVIDSYSILQFRTAKYLIQIDDGVGIGAKFQSTEMLLLANNNRDVFRTQYALIATAGELGTFSADMQVDNIVRLYFTPSIATNKIVTVLRTGITS